MKKTTAINSFIVTIDEINNKLDELKAYTKNHMGYDSGDINWGHIGNAQYFLAILTELTDRAYKRGEYAK